MKPMPEFRSAVRAIHSQGAPDRIGWPLRFDDVFDSGLL
jgi:hypothetical protein